MSAGHVRKVRIPKAVHPTALAQYSSRLTPVVLPAGLPEDVNELYDELEHYCDVLLGREDSPVQSPYLELAEVATAYYARACEIDMLIHRAEKEGSVIRGTEFYKFRTGALRSFIEMSKKMADLGSRRLTQEELISRQRLDIAERF